MLPTPTDVRFVAANMRAADAAEIFATRWTDAPDDIVTDVMHAGPFVWTTGLERPIAVVGAFPSHPGVWQVFMFATDEFPRIGLGMTRFVRKCMIPALIDSNAHRAQCHSIEGHDVAHRWLESLGAQVESVAKGWGRNGEDFRVYVWTRGNVP